MICNINSRGLFAGLLAIGLSLTLAAVGAPGQGIGSGTSKELASAEDGFKINFPARPERIVTNIGTSSNKIFLTKHELVSGAWRYMTTYFDLTQAVDNKLLYDDARDQILTKPGRKLVQERDFYSDKRLGRETIIEEGDTTSIQRLLLVDRRFYQLVVFMPIRFSDSSPAVRSSFQKTANSFLDSFVVTKVSTSQMPAAALPSDFGLTLKNDVVSSEYLGFTLNLPSNLSVLTAEETQLLLAGMNKISTEKIKTHGYFLSMPGTSKALLMMVKKHAVEGELATFSILAERLDLPIGFRPLTMVKEIERLSSEKLGKRIAKPAQTIMIDAVEFARLETVDSAGKFKQRLYVANLKGLALEITMAFQNDADATAMEAALKTIRVR